MPDEHRPQPRYAGFWMRFIAFLIDSVITSVILAPFAPALGDDSPLRRLMDDAARGADPVQIAGELNAALGALAAPAAWSMLILLVLVIALWRYRGATPGKMLIGARIVDADSGADASTAKLVVRFLGYFVSTIVFGLGFLWIAADRRKQGWHDKLAGTLVIRDRGKS